MAADPRHHPRVLWSRIKVRWPFLVWLAAAAGFALLWRDLGVQLTFSGIVRTETRQVVSIELARVLKVHARSGQAVRAGDVLAELDPGVLNGEIAAEVAAAAEANQSLRMDSDRIEHQLQQQIFDAEIGLRDLAIQRAGEEAELAALRVEIARLEPLVEKKVLDPEAVSELKARRDALQMGLEQYPAAEQARRDNIAWAKSFQERVRQRAEGAASPEDAPAAAALRARLPNFTVTAPVSGVITNLPVTAGSAVREGDVLASIVETNSSVVVGFLHEDSVQQLSVGRELWGFLDPSEKEYVKVRVSALGPNVIDLPTGQTLFPGRVIRGRPLLLEIVGPHRLLPGQRLTMRTHLPWWVRKSGGFLHKAEGRL